MFTRQAGVMLAVSLALYLPIGISAQVTNCTAYNVSILGPYSYGKTNYVQHTTGAHSWTNTMSGSCSYTGTAQVGIPVGCAPHATATSSSVSNEYGVTVPNFHNVSPKDKSGLADGAAGATVKIEADAAVAVNSCPLLPCGTPGITFTGTGGGFQTSGKDIIWEDGNHYDNTCSAYTLAALPPPQQQNCNVPFGYPPYPAAQGFTWIWSPAICGWEAVPDGESPVVIDVKRNWGKRELFSDPTKGDYVSFDMQGDGVIKKFSWPKPDSGLAWLALDRDGDGKIKNGTELFGNYTPHADAGIPGYPNPNGFVALSWYDHAAQGGDINAILDERDAIWPKLKLWVDEHCYKERDKPCQSRPEELHNLESEGITSISLVWSGDYKQDALGNEYKYQTVLNPEAAEDRGEYDHKNDGQGDRHQKSKD